MSLIDVPDDEVPGRVTVLSEVEEVRSRAATTRDPYLEDEDVVVRVLFVPRLVSGGDGGRTLIVSPGD